MQIPEVGELIASKYRLEAMIGVGGFAYVYRAVDITIGRSVAVKILQPGHNDTVASRFSREARLLAKLKDAHTMQLFDYGRTATGLRFMVFELLGGVDLRDHLIANPSMDEDSVVRVLSQILESLREAHAAGLLHRDIKPGNIRVYEYMGDPLCVKVMDFGIARGMGPDAMVITQDGRAVGTPRYMSPEQMVGLELTPASDLFCVGLVALEMLFGDPHAGLDDVAAGRSLPASISPNLRAVLERLLQSDVTKRFQSAGEVLAALGVEVAPPLPLPIPEEQPVVDHVPPSVAVIEESDEGRRVQWPLWAGVLSVFAVAAVALIASQRAAPAPRRDLREVLKAPPGPGETAVVAAAPVLDAGVSEPDAAPPVDANSPFAEGCAKSGDRKTRLVADWVVHVPPSYRPGVPHPLLIVFRGMGKAVEDMLGAGGIRRFADEHGVIVIAPPNPDKMGTGKTIDLEPLNAIFETTRGDLCIDPARVFVLGHDTGGYPAEALSREPWVTAVATTSFRPAESIPNPDDRPIPRILFSPLHSKRLPIDGGSTCVPMRAGSLDDYENGLRARNGCGDAKKEYLRGEEVVCETWACDEPLVSCRVDGGHMWTGARMALPMRRCLGTTDFDYMSPIWAFFESVAQQRQDGASGATGTRPRRDGSKSVRGPDD